jgi:hypothetical protein
VGTHRDTPLNTDLNINDERQDCKIGTVCVCVCVCVVLVGGGGGMKEVKVREYGGWTLYTYTK